VILDEAVSALDKSSRRSAQSAVDLKREFG